MRCTVPARGVRIVMTRADFFRRRCSSPSNTAARIPTITAARRFTARIPLEITWSVIPFLFMLVMFAWGTKLYFENYTPPRKDTLDIYVTGKQWMWKIQYPGWPA